MKRLNGKVTIITGGSSGIGEAMAKAFAAEGATVMVADIQDEKGAAVVDAARRAGGKADFIHTDVSDPEQVEHLVEQTITKYGIPDVMVPNAGLQYEKNVVDTTQKELDHVINVNLKGTFYCTKYVLPHMVANGGGSIVVTGSVLSLVAEPNLAAYCASKGGILMLVKAIATDYGGHNIRANCICPGYINTPLGDEWFDNQPDPQAARDQAGALHALGRMGEPEEVAKCAIFLASDDASFVTGSALVVDGGLMAKI